MGEKSRFLAILAALLAAAFRVTSVSPETKESEHQKALAKAAAERKADPANALLQTFSDFDKGYVYISPLLKSGTCASLPRNRSSRPMDWAVATVPDPERSNLKLDFDRQLEAIQNAAESAGYQFERFWFPWHSEQTALPALEKPSESAQAAGTNSLPGVLLFRQPGKDSSRVPGLAIFLVGETPTSGINPAQFRYAACLGSSLHQAETEHSALHIIGPGYSASFDSLAALAKNYDQLTVRSWTSDLNSQQQFRMQMGGRGSQLDLKTTRTSSVVSINSFVAFLRREWREMGPIVLLKEAGTALGSGIKPPKPCAASRSETTLLDIEDCKVFLIEFPRNLSTLRNATESEGHAEGAVDPKSGMPRIGLTLSLRTERASYEIPRFSEAQTPVSQESVLFGIAGLLKTGTVHYVGIIASDPLDVLYLSRYLRSSCPNLRLFTLDPDLLLEHGSDSSDYEGILGVSTYPLFPISQLWSGSRGILHVFPSQTFEGTYNAVLDSLATLGPGAMNPALEKLTYPDLRDPFEAITNSSDLPLWLTVAGRSGFEPVAMLPAPKEELTITPKPGDPRFLPEYWDSWGYCFLIALAACLLFCWAVLAAAPNGERTLALFAVKPNEPAAASRAFYLGAIGACLSTVALVWVLVPGQIIFQNLAADPALPHWKIFSFLLFCCGAMAEGVAFLLTGARRRGEFYPRRRWSLRGLFSPGRPAALTGFSCSLAMLALSFVFLFSGRLQLQGLILSRLWRLFCLGSFILGAGVAATACPVWDLWQSSASGERRRGAGLSVSELSRLFTPRWCVTTAAGATICAIIAAFVLFLVQSRYEPVYFLTACRALDLTSGVSPLVPLSLLMAVLVSLSFVHLKRIAYYEDHCPTLPNFPKDVFCRA